MERAVQLANKAVGYTSPNPSVGALIVKDGKVIGEGFTLPPGQHHAEIVALRQAGSQAKGSALYTTLSLVVPLAEHPLVPRQLSRPV